ncbi:3-hydroxyacyl-ACP dehydratase FabZ family protein [Roseospira marina]|nr:FabA/FabZ family ACP-dehydratase [Roseospira marina]MBB4314666.1 3-hydroxyacyl-[acyl-carrier-protein] dehydratase [Roseospira marina]
MPQPMSRADIASRLDITDPFLMIDTFETLEPGRRARATKELHSNAWFFACHLPALQVMPATLQLEGMLQTLVLLIYAAGDHGAHRAYVTNVKSQLSATATPGQTITFDAELSAFRRGIATGTVTTTANGVHLSRGEFRYASPHLMAAPVPPPSRTS